MSVVTLKPDSQSSQENTSSDLLRQLAHEAVTMTWDQNTSSVYQPGLKRTLHCLEYSKKKRSDFLIEYWTMFDHNEPNSIP